MTLVVLAELTETINAKILIEQRAQQRLAESIDAHNQIQAVLSQAKDDRLLLG